MFTQLQLILEIGLKSHLEKVSVFIFAPLATIVGVSCSVVSTLCDPMDCSPPGSSAWDSPGKDATVGCQI